MSYTSPGVADFKAYFDRDFPYGVDMATSVLDTDITKAFVMTDFSINPAHFSAQAYYDVGYLLLTAHNMVSSLRASSQGINGQYGFLEASKSVGSVSQSFAIPQRILENPTFSMLTKTTYGARYLEMISPFLIGNMFAVCGRTLA